MPRYTTGLRVCGVLSMLAILPSCESTKEIITQKEDHLTAAGFAYKPASTPKLQAMLDHLPAHRFLRRVHGTSVFYIYADPTVCDCLYVGDQAAFSKYQQYRQAKALANEETDAAVMDYQDTTWDWSPWQPWGPGWYAWNPGWNAWGTGPGIEVGW
ncbi:hypothetical protein [Acetobacter vaccinii]|uniref:Uncharacterized protein n=1 Tax=Acetobacter vaccinii TaxID=2592655 RepID=A0A5C1YR75_9PROT|nr:hypothetical protein [Acetobacter vaccinii]QEO18108.1 hypothetical protein FLP30_10485 [Acetobacter vaccinii]